MKINPKHLKSIRNKIARQQMADVDQLIASFWKDVAAVSPAIAKRVKKEL